MKRLLYVPVVMAVLAVGGVAFGQTGPVNGTGGQPVPPKGGPAQPGGMMTADHAADVLRQNGYQVNVQAASNGAKTVIATIVKDNWRYTVELEFSVDQKNMNVIAPLNGPATKFSSEQLLALLKKSYELNPPLHFSYRQADQRILLEDPLYNTVNMTDASFLQIVNNMLNNVRETYPLWGDNGR